MTVLSLLSCIILHSCMSLRIFICVVVVGLQNKTITPVPAVTFSSVLWHLQLPSWLCVIRNILLYLNLNLPHKEIGECWVRGSEVKYRSQSWSLGLLHNILPSSTSLYQVILPDFSWVAVEECRSCRLILSLTLWSWQTDKKEIYCGDEARWEQVLSLLSWLFSFLLWSSSWTWRLSWCWEMSWEAKLW